MAAVGAGHGGIFDDGDRSIRLALDLIAERTRHQQVGHGHFSAGAGLRRGCIWGAPELISNAARGKHRDERGCADEHITAGEDEAGFALRGHVTSVSLARLLPEPSSLFPAGMWQAAAAMPRPGSHGSLTPAPTR